MGTSPLPQLCVLYRNFSTTVCCTGSSLQLLASALQLLAAGSSPLQMPKLLSVLTYHTRENNRIFYTIIVIPSQIKPHHKKANLQGNFCGCLFASDAFNYSCSFTLHCLFEVTFMFVSRSSYLNHNNSIVTGELIITNSENALDQIRCLSHYVSHFSHRKKLLVFFHRKLRQLCK